MEHVEQYLLSIKDWVWGMPLLALFIGSGIYFTLILRGVQFRYLGYAFKQVFARQKDCSQGDISHFEALMTSLAGAIGTGTIVGVATAISAGGLGAIFWMWMTAFLGMAIKYAESLLAVKYRVKDSRGEMAGGPMQYIEGGLGWRWLAVLFALFGSAAAIGTGNLVQVNSITETASKVWSFDPTWTGVALAILTGLVILGGVKSIGQVAGVLVPVMALLYIGAGIWILLMHYENLPGALSLIVSSAFNGQAAMGGFAGATIMTAVQMGVARSIFSNEAGLGISSIAAAAAKTDSPARQAMINMTGALMSTVIVCSITGLVLAVTEVLGMTGENGKPLNGASMAVEAFSTSIYGGSYVVAIGLVLFAFSTVIAWAYYGEKCIEYLFGEKSVIPYRLFYAALVVPGALLKMEIVWHLADIMNGLMVIPNVIALTALSHVVISETTAFMKIADKEQEGKRSVLYRSLLKTWFRTQPKP